MKLFSFSANDTIASFLERFPEVHAVLARLGVETVQDLERPMGGILDEEHLDRLALEVCVPRWEETEDWTSADLESLVLHLVGTHHLYLTSEVPRLLRLTKRLANRASEPVTCELDTRMRAFAEHLGQHLAHEERDLFPDCRGLAMASHGAKVPDGRRLRLSAYELESGHEDMTRELSMLITLATAGCDDPTMAGVQRTLLTGLNALEADLIQHHYEEEDCLIPAALHCQEVRSRPVRRHEESVHS